MSPVNAFVVRWPALLMSGAVLAILPLRGADSAPIPGAPPFKILFIGDSITRHGIKPELKWDHVAGMAASTEANDYAHQLARMIQGPRPGRRVEACFPTNPDEAALIAKYGVSSAQERAAMIGPSQALHPDLVVVQLGEHEAKDKGAEALRTNYDKLLSLLQSWSPRPAILCTGVWCPLPPLPHETTPHYYGWPDTINRTMAEVAGKHGIPFVDVEDIALDPSCHGSGQSKGVQWHPNDQGQLEYAQHLFAAFQKLPAAAFAGKRSAP